MNIDSSSQTVHVIFGAALLYSAVVETIKSLNPSSIWQKYVPAVFIFSGLLCSISVFYYSPDHFKLFVPMIFSLLSLGLAAFFAPYQKSWERLYFTLHIVAALFIALFPKAMAENFQQQEYISHLFISASLVSFALLKLTGKQQVGKAAAILLFITAFQMIFYDAHKSSFLSKNEETYSLTIQTPTKDSTGENKKNTGKKDSAGKQKRQNSK